ncbi:uncharacterized protein LOC105199477 [Solenopsis invicta]|uniref:uncharacterized protein LOC105199477 n=1 Tax=Solenopsis invicta TaxID=13686 RepID=UPI0005958894|nr:uncharacterized protein LOC105199477 [Solenopsis invicta]
MRNLSGDQISNDLLRTLFLEHMPQNVRGILAAAASQDLAQLATLADKVAEAFNTTNQVMAVTACEQQSTPDSGRLADEVKQIKDQLEALSVQLKENNERGRSRTRSRSRPRYHSSRSRGRIVNIGTCYYHQKFGAQAYCCRKPCDWKAPLPATSPTTSATKEN